MFNDKASCLKAVSLVLWVGACASGEVGSALDERELPSVQSPQSEGDPNTAEPSAAPAAAPAASGTTTTPAPVQPVQCPVGQQPNGFVGGPSTCCSGAYQICDDFEGDATGGSPNAKFWEVDLLNYEYGKQANVVINPNEIDRGVIMEISEAKSARGKKSLHILAQNSNKLPHNGAHHDMLLNRSIFPAPNNTFWGRAFVYYVQDADNDYPGGHVTLASASGTVPAVSPKNFYTWWRVSTYRNFLINCERGDGSESTPVRMPTNRWACLEWHYKGDAENSITLYMDGNQLVKTTKATATTNNPMGLAPAYDAFRLGWEVYSWQYNPTPKQFEMYYDEVALDYNRIGCDR